MKNVPVDVHGHVIEKELAKFIDDTEIMMMSKDDAKKLTPNQLESLKKSYKKKMIFKNFFNFIKPNSEFDLLLVLKVE